MLLTRLQAKREVISSPMPMYLEIKIALNIHYSKSFRLFLAAAVKASARSMIFPMDPVLILLILQIALLLQQLVPQEVLPHLIPQPNGFFDRYQEPRHSILIPKSPCDDSLGHGSLRGFALNSRPFPIVLACWKRFWLQYCLSSRHSLPTAYFK